MNEGEPRPTNVVPLVPQRRAQGYADEIEALMRRAEAEGRGTLAHLLECALIEARHQVVQEARDRAERDADPRDLYRPA